MTDQEKREKLIAALQMATDVIERWVPMFEQHNTPAAIQETIELLKALLKAQEPVEPIPTTDDDWTCGHCGMSLVGYEELDAGGFTTVRHYFCPNCGKKVKWE